MLQTIASATKPERLVIWRKRVRQHLDQNGESKDHNNDVEVEIDEDAASVCGVEMIAHEDPSEEP